MSFTAIAFATLSLVVAIACADARPGCPRTRDRAASVALKERAKTSGGMASARWSEGKKWSGARRNSSFFRQDNKERASIRDINRDTVSLGKSRSDGIPVRKPMMWRERKDDSNGKN